MDDNNVSIVSLIEVQPTDYLSQCEVFDSTGPGIITAEWNLSSESTHLDDNLRQIKSEVETDAIEYKHLHVVDSPSTDDGLVPFFVQDVDETMRHHLNSTQSIFYCDVCNQIFYSDSQLRSHLDSHLEIKFYNCVNSDQDFQSPDDLVPNVLAHNIKKRANSQNSQETHKKKYRTKSVLKSNERSVVSSSKRVCKRYKCLDCNKQFKNAGGLNLHVLIHIKKSAKNSNKKFYYTLRRQGSKTGFKSTHPNKIHTRKVPHKREICIKKTQQHSKDKTKRQLSHKKVKASAITINETKSNSPKILKDSEKCQPLHKEKKQSTQAITRPGPKLKNNLKENKPLCLRPDLICPICNKKFTSNSKFKIHQVVHSEERPFACSVCDKKFKYKNSLEYHERIHSDQLFPCSTCGKRFTRESGLKRHQIVHVDFRHYACDICNKKLQSLDGLRKHVQIHLKLTPEEGGLPSKNTTKVKPENLTCRICHKMQNSLKSLRNHESLHTKEKLLICNYCGKRFFYPIHLHRHLQMHSDVRQFSCMECGRCYKQMTSLASHMKIHGNIKLISCDKCDRKFSQPSHLKRHLLVHSETKQFICIVCDQQFKFPNSLKDHLLRVHAIST
ncbi:zinc finger protein 260-like [Physella acuta]|uniref:zinc finger protein 260-like n=1 Tax=Physella acuta TaxID=109671 RepID=UPI0027DE4469|nr:zinc finger protein 260-like [Physella acuta]XP_059141029.1 zinc finger protein 260-like [Physella acuta]